VKKKTQKNRRRSERERKNTRNGTTPAQKVKIVLGLEKTMIIRLKTTRERARTKKVQIQRKKNGDQRKRVKRLGRDGLENV